MRISADSNTIESRLVEFVLAYDVSQRIYDNETDLCDLSLSDDVVNEIDYILASWRTENTQTIKIDSMRLRPVQHGIHAVLGVNPHYLRNISFLAFASRLEAFITVLLLVSHDSV